MATRTWVCAIGPTSVCRRVGVGGSLVTLLLSGLYKTIATHSQCAVDTAVVVVLIACERHLTVPKHVLPSWSRHTLRSLRQLRCRTLNQKRCQGKQTDVSEHCHQSMTQAYVDRWTGPPRRSTQHHFQCRRLNCSHRHWPCCCHHKFRCPQSHHYRTLP